MQLGKSLFKVFVTFQLLMLPILAGVAPVQAEPLSAPEYQVKAAFIYHFAKFIEWPTEAMEKDGPFMVGVVGQDPFGNYLDEVVSGKRIRDRKIVVKRFSKIEEAVHSHILFISGSEGENLDRNLKQLGRSPILTVSDIDRFAGKGGMVQLEMDGNRVHFAVNLAAFDRAGLKPSSQLLKLARIVPDGGMKERLPHDEWLAGGSPHPLRIFHLPPREKSILPF
jgi:hypothetical protein